MLPAAIRAVPPATVPADLEIPGRRRFDVLDDLADAEAPPPSAVMKTVAGA